ncbi:hypothetical protein [Nocardia sp. NBC_01009]|uniref:hypothetical protein n=1 Tax=Nocardia sp. NBC_01009 TaxID=2975996 RepID=UPI003866EB2A|nr:hypothetical protein OHA42_28690 [Nocardia sp. NBC_01009]
MRIAHEMAAKHDLEIIGFDTAGISEPTIREIAVAVDDMLAKYPIPLRGIEITETRDGRPSRLVREQVSEGEQQGPPANWIVLDRAAVANPIRAAGAVASATRTRAGRHDYDERPVYVTIVREFGRALDTAGNFRAHQEAQRTLITESLRGGGSFGHGLLDPGTALVEGFTEVVLRGDRAGGVATALHGALVQMAKAISVDPDEP